MKSKKILIISYSNINRDIRVQKHISYFSKLGYKTIVLWNNLDEIKKFSIVKKLAYLFFLCFYKEKAVEILYGKLKYAVFKEEKFDIILANDWNTLPSAYWVSKYNDSKIIYDSHELAVKEFENSIKWKVLILPIIKSMERKYIKKVHLVSSVVPFITTEIKNRYSVKNAITIRNIPEGSMINCLSKVIIDSPIKIYHHGVYIKLRDIESFIKSILVFSDKFELYLRLVGDVSELKKKYSNCRNIILLDPVNSTEVLHSCIPFHIGMPSVSPANTNYKICLPNKFFEYLFSGLPVIVSADNVSMANYVRKYSLGFIAKKYSTDCFVETLKAISIDDIISCRKNVKNFVSELSSFREWQKYAEFL